MMSHKALKLMIIPMLLGASCIPPPPDPPPPPPPPPPADIGFLWSFDGEADCNAAGVARVLVFVLDEGGEVVREVDEPCIGGGLTLIEFNPGVYTIDITGVAGDDIELFTATQAVDARLGGPIDLGVVELAPFGTPIGDEGDVAVQWSFLYPANTATADCVSAGVYELDVSLVPEAGTDEEPYQTTIGCLQAGGLSIAARPGNYVLRVLAFGVFNAADALRYDSGDIRLSVADGQTTDLGVRALPRVVDAFADISLRASAAAGSCVDVGMVRFVITRLSTGFIEDDVSVACGTETVRNVFVPDGYQVTATAMQAGVALTATTTIATNPSAVTAVSMVLSVP